MANKDYQLEELENAAVNKSNDAKRIAAAAGFLAAGGAAGYAATNISGMAEEPVETLTEEDLDTTVKTGADQVQEPQPEQQQQTVYVQQPAQEEPAPEPKQEIDVDFKTSTHYYDENNHLVGTVEEGTINGKDFTLVDYDGDSKADLFAYDENGNGYYEGNEIVRLEGDNQLAMGHEATEHKDVFLADTMPEPAPDPIDPDPIDPDPYYIDDEKDLTEDNIENDFEDEKTGETYEHDYAENNEDYNNNGDVDNYTAGHSDDADDYAYNEEEKHDDYDYDDSSEDEVSENDLAENDDSFDDSIDDTADDSDSLDIV